MCKFSTIIYNTSFLDRILFSKYNFDSSWAMNKYLIMQYKVPLTALYLKTLKIMFNMFKIFRLISDCTLNLFSPLNLTGLLQIEK